MVSVLAGLAPLGNEGADSILTPPTEWYSRERLKHAAFTTKKKKLSLLQVI